MRTDSAGLALSGVVWFILAYLTDLTDLTDLADLAGLLIWLVGPVWLSGQGVPLTFSFSNLELVWVVWVVYEVRSTEALFAWSTPYSVWRRGRV
jgi:hypothetical protein